jgi:hypothetical protein
MGAPLNATEPAPADVVARVDDGGTTPVLSACTRSVALWKRWSGFFSSNRMTMAAKPGGTSGRRCEMGTGASARCFTSRAGVVLPRNGGSPHSVW